jgi:excisionase family DNA binding protein
MNAVSAVNMDERYLTDIEVAQLTGLKRATLSRHRFDRRGIPFYKIGRSVRYKWIDVKAYMDKHRIETD